MNPDETVDPTIRNQRDRGWSDWAWLGAWFGVWLLATFVLVRFCPREWQGAALAGTAVPMFVSSVLLRRYLRCRPVLRLKLGDELRAYPFGRLKPADIHALHIGPDSDEDYADAKLPVPWCLVAVEGRRRTLRLVASAGDAARLREWAERYGVLVDDPQGLAVVCRQTGEVIR